MNNTGSIYAIYHKDESKYYIGKTSLDDPQDRIKDHFRGRGSKVLWNAIQHHGKESFNSRVLHHRIPAEDLNSLERHCVWIFNSIVPNGYNLKLGGEGGPHSEDTIKRMKENHRGFTGKRHSEESKRQIGETQKGKKSYERSEEFRKQRSEKLKGKKVGKPLNRLEFYKWRKSLNLTRKQLQDKIGIHMESIRRWETEDCGLSKRSIQQFQDVFGFDPTERFKTEE